MTCILHVTAKGPATDGMAVCDILNQDSGVTKSLVRVFHVLFTSLLNLLLSLSLSLSLPPMVYGDGLLLFFSCPPWAWPLSPPHPLSPAHPPTHPLYTPSHFLLVGEDRFLELCHRSISISRICAATMEPIIRI